MSQGAGQDIFLRLGPHCWPGLVTMWLYSACDVRGLPMAPTPDAPLYDDSPPEIAALHREVSALIHRWQQAGVALHEVAMVLATVGCQALGHALGEVAPPDGPEIIQDITRALHSQAESCWCQNGRGDTPT